MIGVVQVVYQPLDINMTYNEWMNEIENYATRYDRFLEEWDNGISVERMQEWLEAAYDMGLKHNVQ